MAPAEVLDQPCLFCGDRYPWLEQPMPCLHCGEGGTLWLCSRCGHQLGFACDLCRPPDDAPVILPLRPG